MTSPDWRVDPGGTLEIEVRIDGGDLAEGQYFGGITLDPASTAHQIFLPVAFTTASASMRTDESDRGRVTQASGRASRLGSVRV